MYTTNNMEISLKQLFYDHSMILIMQFFSFRSALHVLTITESYVIIMSFIQPWSKIIFIPGLNEIVNKACCDRQTLLKLNEMLNGNLHKTCSD